MKANRFEYRKSNPEKVKAKVAEYRTANPEKLKASNAVWAKANPEKVKASITKYRKANPGKFLAQSNKRRAAKLQRTPNWLTPTDFKFMEAYYKLAKVIENHIGEKVHIDHVVPLQGRTVSGLHVPSNLKVMFAEDNLSKSNKF